MATLLPAATESLSTVVTDVLAENGPGVAVAVNVNGGPDRLPDVAVSVFVPVAVPIVQLPSVAMPLALPTGVAPVMLPPPDATANVTVTPETGLLLASRTRAAGATATDVFTGADCPLPAEMAIWLGAPGMTVIVGCAEVTSRPSIVAARERAGPADAPGNGAV